MEPIRSLNEFIEPDKEQGVDRSYLYYKSSSYHLHTEKQDIDLIDSPVWGHMLFLDNVLQSSTRDEVIYHNALVHPLLELLQDRSNILILGGGEGATAREVLRWSDVCAVTMVDYDKDLVDLMKAQGYKWHRDSFKNPKLTLVYEDAWEYMKTPSEFSAIIIDLTDPSLKKERWLSLLQMSINKITMYHGGIVMNAGLYLPWDTERLKEIKAILDSLCSKHPEFTYTFYTAMIPSFNGEWTFVILKHVDLASVSPDTSVVISEVIKHQIRLLPVSVIVNSEGSMLPSLDPISKAS